MKEQDSRTDAYSPLLDDQEWNSILSLLNEEPAAKAEQPAAEEPHPQLSQEEPPISEPEEAPPRKSRPVWIAALAVILVTLLGVGGFFLAKRMLDPYNSRIVSGVSAAGVDLGGMTKKEARNAIAQAVGDVYSKADMVVTLPGTTLTFSPKDSGASLDINGLVNQAFAIGRKGDTQAAELPLLPHLGLKEDVIRAALDAYAAPYADRYIPSGYRLEGEMPALEAERFQESAPCQTLVVQVGAPGFAVDMEHLYQDILDAYNERRFAVTSPAPKAEMEPEKLDIDAIYDDLYYAPLNPSVDKQTLEIIPGTYGYRFDLEAARAKLEAAAPGESFTVPMEYVAPAVQGEDVYFQDILGYCMTPHGATTNRNNNLAKACGLINGVIIRPGETFSYNETLGERTEALGWLPAPAYSGTELKDSPGGGICQVSSTLYLCSLFAELETVERTNHGYPVNYIPIGLDATVNWGFSDLKLKNNSQLPVKIAAIEEEDYVKVWILGTELRDYYVKMLYGSNDRFATSYKIKYDRETNEMISKEFERRSAYLDEVPSYRGERGSDIPTSDFIP